MSELLDAWVDPLTAWVPVIAVALLTLVCGLLLAAVVRSVVRSVVRRAGLDSLAERLGVVRLLYAVNLKSGVDVLLGNVAGLTVLLITAMIVAETVGLPGIAEGLGAVVEFLPRFVSAGIVALAGFVAADFGSRLAEGIGRRRADLVAPKFAASIVYYVVLAVFLATAVQHLGLDTDLVDGLIVLLVAVSLGSVGLSFALGSRDVVRDVLARQYARPLVQPGDRVAVADVEGVVVRFDSVTVSLRLDDDTTHILPCRSLLTDSGIRIVSRGGEP